MDTQPPVLKEGKNKEGWGGWQGWAMGLVRWWARWDGRPVGVVCRMVGEQLIFGVKNILE